MRRSPYPATVRRLAEALGLDQAGRGALQAAAQTCPPAPGPPARALPRPLSSFVGRQDEIATLRELLRTRRLVTLTGTGGIGKTRLAVEVARASVDAVFVDLAPLVDGGLVPTAVAGALGVREQPNVPLPELLSGHLADRDLLLVLDNCEHVVDACAELAERFLATCPCLRVLATSRERLGLAGETTWRVPSLALPEGDDSTARLAECEALRLFVDRAAAIAPGFALTAANGPSLASVCRRLDGIPLAIELAAATRGEYAAARNFFEQGLSSAQEAGDPWAEARNLDGLAALAIEQADFGQAERLLDRSLELARALDDTWSLAAVRNTLGDLARTQAEYARAGRLYEQSRALFEGLGSQPRASILHNLAYVAVHERDYQHAADLLAESLRLYQARGEQRGVVECLVGFGCLAAAGGEPERAARLFGAADAAFKVLNAELSPSNRADYARWLAVARDACSRPQFDAARADGLALSLEEAIQEVLQTGLDAGRA